MRSFKTLSAVVLLLVLKVGHAQSTENNTEPVVQNDSWDQLVNPDQAKKMADNLKSSGAFNPNENISDQDGSFARDTGKEVHDYIKKNQGNLSSFSAEAVQNQTAKFMTEAQELSNAALAGARKGMQNLGMSQEQASNFGGVPTAQKQEDFAILISFSMSDAEIKDALQTAAEAGGRVYLKGLKKGHTSITQTMKILRGLAVDLKSQPEANFNPTVFDDYSVTQVPFIIYRKGKDSYTAKGIMNLRWIKGKSLDGEKPGDFGVMGPTYPVEEVSLIETMKQRMAQYDWEGQKKKTIQTFWSRQAFEVLPPAVVDQVWFINPTVKVTSDVKNPRGDILARAGDIINPLDNPVMAQNFVVFDATDLRQVEWATKVISSKNNVGQMVLMTSRVDQKKGWEHMDALRSHFNSEVYVMPKELVKRFKLGALPVFISPDMKKKVFKVEQYSMEDGE